MDVFTRGLQPYNSKTKQIINSEVYNMAPEWSISWLVNAMQGEFIYTENALYCEHTNWIMKQRLEEVTNFNNDFCML